MVALLGYESSVLYKICASIDELLRKAFDSRILQAITITTSGLMQGLGKAIDADAFTVFNKLLDEVKLSMVLAMNVENSETRKHMLEIITSALEYFCSFRIVWNLLDEEPDLSKSL